jgi:hypothetical protein
MIKAVISAVLLAAISTYADAQVANIPGVYLSGSPPTGFSAQSFKLDCNNATPTSGQCWPLMEIYDAAGNQATVNASDHGLTVHQANSNPNGQNSVANSQPVVPPLATYSQDPCYLHGDIVGTATKQSVAFSSSAAAFTLVAPVALNQVYICFITLVSTAADSISLVGGLAPNCTTGTPLAMAGSLTAANGMDIAANQGWVAGSGLGTVYSTATSGHGVCILQSGATKIAGSIVYVQTQF